MLPLKDFKTVVASTPLISIDFIVRNEKHEVLLGRRVNRPAKNYFFTLGGRIYKDETIHNAMSRIAKEEIGIDLDRYQQEFIGVFQHFYEDSFVEKGVSTHYINLGYEVKPHDINCLPMLQHSEYQWFSESSLLQSNEVHQYVKEYFKH